MRPVTGLVARPRLHRLLDGAGRVTLICAPAGSGKTMLVASWLEGTGGVAWVGVDRDEADPIRFWTKVMDAVRTSGAVADGDPLATRTPAPAGGPDEFLARLLDGIERLRRPLVRARELRLRA